MKYFFHFVLITLFVLGCTNGSKTDKSQKNTERKESGASPLKKPKVHGFGNKIYYDEEFETTDFLIRNTVKDLRYVQNIWSDTLFLSFDAEEQITHFIKLDSNRILVETKKDDTGYLYVYSLDNIQLNKLELDFATNYYYSDYVFNNQKVYFKSRSRSLENKYWVLSPDSLQIKELQNPDDYFHLFRSKNYDIYNKYPSPDGSTTIKIDYNEMFLIDNSIGNEELLIDIHSDSFWADWCFDNACWHDNSKKFYFDNSGEIACIWEVDLERKTIDKIVPEHFAEKPVYMDSAVYYLDRGCIRRTHFVEYGKSRKIQYGKPFDNINKAYLLEENFHISKVENYPDSLLLPNTISANLAVNADRGVYKVKFLYAINDSIFTLTSAMTLLYADYKCEEPQPHFTNGMIRFKCEWKDGRTYGEKFKVENYKLVYNGSYYVKTQ